MARRLTPAQHQDIAARVEDGESHASLAKAYGCTRDNISQICLTLGAEAPGTRTPPRPILRSFLRAGVTVHRFSDVEDRKLLFLAAKGLVPAQIGHRLGRHRHSVRGRLKTLARREARAEAAALTPILPREGERRAFLMAWPARAAQGAHP